MSRSLCTLRVAALPPPVKFWSAEHQLRPVKDTFDGSRKRGCTLKKSLLNVSHVSARLSAISSHLSSFSNAPARASSAIARRAAGIRPVDVIRVTTTTKAVVTIPPLADGLPFFQCYEVFVRSMSTRLCEWLGHIKYFCTCLAKKLAIILSRIGRHERCMSPRR